MRLLLTSLTVALVLGGGVSANPIKRDDRVPFTSKDLVGEWRTPCAPSSVLGFPGGGRWLIRYSVLDRASGYTRWSFFTDADCQQPIYSTFVSFDLELGEPTNERNTREGRLILDKLLVTPQAEAGLQLVKDCGANGIGQEIDVTESGCAGLRLASVTECPYEYELYRLDPGQSWATGIRTPNQCTPEGRPTRTQVEGAATPIPGA